MPTWELWKHDDGEAIEYGFGSDRQLILAAFDPADPAELVWTIEAESYVEAMTLYHEHMGWEPYRPMD